MRVQPLDTLLAIKAINVAPDLKPRDKQVACVLIEHFNRKTAQCDPGLERIAALLQVSSRTVMRSIERLEKACLFRVTRHGGHCNRNSYEPRWDRFQELARAWDKRFKESARSRTNLSLSLRQACQVDSDKPVTQTCRSNLLEETCADEVATRYPNAPSAWIASKGPAGRGRSEILPRSAPERPRRSGTPRHEAARTAAERRVWNDLQERYCRMPALLEDIIASIDPATANVATDAELRQRGAGLQYILERRRAAGIDGAKVPVEESAEEEATQ